MSKTGKKEFIKNYFNFKFLITEKVMKWAYIVLSVLAVLGSIFGGITSFISSISMIATNAVIAGVATMIFGTIGWIIGAFLALFFLRIFFEFILVFFLTYREMKELNEKTATPAADDESGAE